MGFQRLKKKWNEKKEKTKRKVVKERPLVSESLWPFTIKYIRELILRTETRLHDTREIIFDVKF